MMKENHNTQSCEYIITCQDGLYIASTTPREILYMLKDKYKINTHLQHKYPHDPGGRDICQCQIKKYLESYMSMSICVSITTKQPIIIFHSNLPSSWPTKGILA